MIGVGMRRRNVMTSWRRRRGTHWRRWRNLEMLGVWGIRKVIEPRSRQKFVRFLLSWGREIQRRKRIRIVSALGRLVIIWGVVEPISRCDVVRLTRSRPIIISIHTISTLTYGSASASGLLWIGRNLRSKDSPAFDNWQRNIGNCTRRI